MMEDFYSILTSEPMQNLHVRVSKFLSTCLIQDFSPEDEYSHPAGPCEKRKRPSLRKRPLQRACSDTMQHIEDKYALPRLHVNFSRRDETAQLNGLKTGDVLQRMRRTKHFYAVYMVFPFTALFTEWSLGLEELCELTRVI